LEHCHVDEERDSFFCDTEEELVAFGIADAVAVAKYFGLKSEKFGIDYSQEVQLPEANAKHLVQSTLTDESVPDVCIAELGEINPDTGNVELHITAADYDSPLMYYAYSINGGNTFSSLQMWPGYNTFDGSYQDTFTLNIQIPSGIQPNIVFRAYNMFDGYTDSNKVNVLHRFMYEDETITTEPSTEENNKEEKELPGTTTFMPVVNEQTEEIEGVSFFTFLQLCFVIVVGLFIMLLISRVITLHQRRKRRRQRRKDSGDIKNHIR
jgi:hypothetical protein